MAGASPSNQAAMSAATAKDRCRLSIALLPLKPTLSDDRFCTRKIRLFGLFSKVERIDSNRVTKGQGRLAPKTARRTPRRTRPGWCDNAKDCLLLHQLLHSLVGPTAAAAPTNKTRDFIVYSDQCCALRHLPPPLSGNISVIGQSLVINHGSCLGSAEAAGIGESAAQVPEGRRNSLSC